MATRLDARLLPKIKALILKYGKDAVFTEDAGSYNPATREVTSSETTTTVKISPPQPYDERMLDGETYRAGDCKCMIAAKDLTVTLNSVSKVTFDGRVWELIHYEPFYTGESIGAYQLHLRS